MYGDEFFLNGKAKRVMGGLLATRFVKGMFGTSKLRTTLVTVGGEPSQEDWRELLKVFDGVLRQV